MVVLLQLCNIILFCASNDVVFDGCCFQFAICATMTGGSCCCCRGVVVFAVSVLRFLLLVVVAVGVVTALQDHFVP